MKSLFILLGAAAVLYTHACTTILVGRNATSDGSVMCSHTNDGDGKTDPRLVFVPAMSHAPNAQRPIFFTGELYPRYLTRERGIPAYFPAPGQAPQKPIGYIPQVAHTYKYIEECYGAINEHQLGMGESTCSCVSWTDKGGNVTKPCSTVGQQGCALMSIDTLGRIALERVATASDAVQLMGDLAEKYGFYGADSFEGSAESLMVIDKEEGWVFHVLPHPSGSSAIWGAARVPPDHVAVIANTFNIRRMNLSDTENFKGSSFMASIASEYKLDQYCKSNDNCDFTRTFSDGEYAHKYYSGRRMWGALRLLAPDNDLSSTYDDLKHDAPYPFSVPVDPKGTGHRVDLALAIRTHRDHYEGTEYDLTKGLASGPFGTPNRFDPGEGERKVKGNWERAISLYRTSDSYIVQTRADVPDGVGGVVWFGPHVSHATTYTPFPIGINSLPDEYVKGHHGVLDKNTAFWATRFVGNLMDLKYSYMVHDVQLTQHTLENSSMALLKKFQDSREVNSDALTTAFTSNARKGVQVYQQLFDHLMFKYADGWVNTPDDLSQDVGYPAWWLSQVNYAGGPPPIPPHSAITD